MTVWILVVEHRHGFNHYANKTKEGMLDTLAEYAREWWDEHDFQEEMPLTRDELIEAYFDLVYDEWYTYDEVVVNE